jgi:hypothetical protein
MIQCDACSQQRRADHPYCQFCGSPATVAAREPQRAGAIQEVEEVMLDSLRAKDYLIMQTENSIYRLTMLEPATRRGLLSGGKLDRRGIQVTLVATTPVSAQSGGSQVMTIKKNSRALFAIDAEEGVEHFITSVIMKLTQVKGGRLGVPAAER